jgi:hypothetical protein
MLSADDVVDRAGARSTSADQAIRLWTGGSRCHRAAGGGGDARFDRRLPVRWLFQHTGLTDFAELRAAGMNGMYLTEPLRQTRSCWLRW